MRNFKIFIFSVALILFGDSLFAQTKIDATVLLKSGANSTLLTTNSSGNVVWGNAASLLTEGAGIDITGNTISQDLVSLTALGAAPDNADLFGVYDASASTLKKVTYAELISGITYTLSDGTNTQTLNVGNTLLFANSGTDGFDFVVGATDQVSFNYDFTELSALGTVDAGTDRILIYDASSGEYRYVLPNQLSSTTSFTLSDGTNTQTLESGNTILFDDATARGIDVTVTATDQINVALDINELTALTAIDVAADYIPIYDASANAVRKVLLNDLIKEPAEFSVNIASNTAANTNIATGQTLADYRKIAVYLDGVLQRDTDDWIISGNNLQFTFATNAGQVISVIGYQ
jgi:hypothetical protein